MERVMNEQLLISLGLSAIIFILLLIVAIRYGSKLRKSHKTTWEELMQRIVPVDRRAIETVALDAVEPSGEPRSEEHPRELGRKDIWNLLGGMEGINRIESNARVIIEMAAYLERWHPEAAETAEELRLEARRLEWHVGRLRSAETNHCLHLHFHSYGQSAAVSYYLMLNRILALYQHSQAALFGDVQRVLGEPLVH
jgi:hypothetical protein